MSPAKKKSNHSSGDSGAAPVARAFFQLIGTMTERFGWPGTVLAFGMFFVEMHATEDQKRRIIETYVLGNGIGDTWPIIVLSLLFVGVLYAQKRLYSKKVAEIEHRLSEVADEKGRLQEAGAGTGLRHSKNRKQGG